MLVSSNPEILFAEANLTPTWAKFSRIRTGDIGIQWLGQDFISNVLYRAGYVKKGPTVRKCIWYQHNFGYRLLIKRGTAQFPISGGFNGQWSINGGFNGQWSINGMFSIAIGFVNPFWSLVNHLSSASSIGDYSSFFQPREKGTLFTSLRAYPVIWCPSSLSICCSTSFFCQSYTFIHRKQSNLGKTILNHPPNHHK